MIPFPTSFPADALKVIGEYVLQKKGAIPDVANASWNVLGYVGFQSVGNPVIAMDCCCPCPATHTEPTDVEKSTFFVSCEMTSSVSGDMSKFTIPPWLITILTNILLNFFKK